MKPISTQLTEYNDRAIKTEKEIFEENRRKLSKSLDLAVGDLVVFRKREFTRVQIVGKIQGIDKQTIFVQTFVSLKGVNEFYLDISEVKKYDSASYKHSNQTT